LRARLLTSPHALHHGLGALVIGRTAFGSGIFCAQDGSFSFDGLHARHKEFEIAGLALADADKVHWTWSKVPKFVLD